MELGLWVFFFSFVERGGGGGGGEVYVVARMKCVSTRMVRWGEVWFF